MSVLLVNRLTLHGLCWAGSKDPEYYWNYHGFIKQSFRTFLRHKIDAFSCWSLPPLHHTRSWAIGFTTKALAKISLFLIQKGIQEIVCTLKSIKKVLFSSKSPNYRNLSLRFNYLKSLANIHLVSKVHRGLNQSKVILFDRDHDLDGIPKQGVVSVKQRNDTIEATNTYMLTFLFSNTTDNIRLGFTRWKLTCLYQIHCVVLNVSGVVMDKKCKGCDTFFASVVKRDMTAKASKRTPKVKELQGGPHCIL